MKHSPGCPKMTAAGGGGVCTCPQDPPYQIGQISWNGGETDPSFNGRYNQSYAAGYARAIEDAAKVADDESVRNKEAAEKAWAAGRHNVSACRASDADMADRIAAAIRALKLESGGKG
jgi:hypothetical protein